ncbi:MAG: hypothetical protein E6J73_03650 [Deltaproteobacteria bacterium]|nr:MAG: hypothetical protein E6J73_03650 [Deltaproteobacteria bacterium]
MKKVGLCFVMLAGAVMLASPVTAQDAALIQAARKEGKVVWHTSLACLQDEIYGNRRRAPSHGFAAGTAKIHAGSGGGN